MGQFPLELLQCPKSLLNSWPSLSLTLTICRLSATVPIKQMERWSHNRLLELAKVTQAWKTKSQDLNPWKIPRCHLTSLPPCYYSTGPRVCVPVFNPMPACTRGHHITGSLKPIKICVIITWGCLSPSSHPSFLALPPYCQDQWGWSQFDGLAPSSWWEGELLRRKAHPCWDSCWAVQVPLVSGWGAQVSSTCPPGEKVSQGKGAAEANIVSLLTFCCLHSALTQFYMPSAHEWTTDETLLKTVTAKKSDQFTIERKHYRCFSGETVSHF